MMSKHLPSNIAIIPLSDTYIKIKKWSGQKNFCPSWPIHKYIGLLHWFRLRTRKNLILSLWSLHGIHNNIYYTLLLIIFYPHHVYFWGRQLVIYNFMYYCTFKYSCESNDIGNIHVMAVMASCLPFFSRFS